jgi:hypothetical protein
VDKHTGRRAARSPPTLGSDEERVRGIMKKWNIFDGGRSRFHAQRAARDKSVRGAKTRLSPRESNLERMNRYSRACVEGDSICAPRLWFSALEHIHMRRRSRTLLSRGLGANDALRAVARTSARRSYRRGGERQSGDTAKTRQTSNRADLLAGPSGARGCA